MSKAFLVACTVYVLCQLPIIGRSGHDVDITASDKDRLGDVKRLSPSDIYDGSHVSYLNSSYLQPGTT